MKQYFFLLVILILFITSCSLPPEYSGTKYSRTQHVDMYYSFNDVKKDYTVIGHLTSHKYSDQTTQHNLLASAGKIGGDAIILTGFDMATDQEGAVVLKYKTRSL